MRILHIIVSSVIFAEICTALSFDVVDGRRALPTSVSVATAKSYLGELVVEPEFNDPPYNRSLFPHWITISGTCNTHETVLKRDGQNVATDSECRSTSGAWYCRTIIIAKRGYPGLEVGPPSVEGHLTCERFRAPTVSCCHPKNNVNRAKGDKDPAIWIPPLPSYHCIYARSCQTLLWVSHSNKIECRKSPPYSSYYVDRSSDL
ncbi:hypothetical protein RSAG8_08278, partial [Rhizoctonia solani AG-8 WAC10335]